MSRLTRIILGITVICVITVLIIIAINVIEGLAHKNNQNGTLEADMDGVELNSSKAGHIAEVVRDGETVSSAVIIPNSGTAQVNGQSRGFRRHSSPDIQIKTRATPVEVGSCSCHCHDNSFDTDGASHNKKHAPSSAISAAKHRIVATQGQTINSSDFIATS
ncbi:hypothetical protein NEFER03_1046 [Nematocida sp. LUAm3]|nr:hypothetical protein NEFER03_1046 [Nematocida sp. LUAm3]KAI5177693.1 hypothetical protein NEFER01_0917 [Nematocida sp. LUAm1]